MSEHNKLLVRRAIDEVWNGGNLVAIDEFVAGDFVAHGSTLGGDIHGPEGARRFFAALRDAFPDIRFTIEDQIAEGDRVVTRWTARATHTGTFLGVPPTGRPIRITATDVDRIANGKVVECWSQMDDLGLMQQLGVVSTLSQVR
jgi:steroid delta-isomerase-like uncharacterized protein